MYFWKISALKEQLCSTRIDASDQLKYYVATTVVFVAVIGLLPLFAPIPQPNRYDFASVTIEIAATVMGALYVYARNGGAVGKDFLIRAVSIGWVLGIRFIPPVLIALVVLVIATDSLDGDVTEETGIWTPIGALAFYALYYWRFGVHISDVARANTDPALQWARPPDNPAVE